MIDMKALRLGAVGRFLTQIGPCRVSGVTGNPWRLAITGYQGVSRKLEAKDPSILFI